MTFQISYPTYSRLLGERNVRRLEDHYLDLAIRDDTAAVAHFSVCELADWCALNSTATFRDRLSLIEEHLQTIESVLGSEAVHRAFSTKAANANQFNELLAEIATASACATNATLVELEWPTGKRNYDADVRSEIAGEKVNFEVTMRTDGWFPELAVHMEDIFDEHGNEIGDYPMAKSRRTLTERQFAIAHDFRTAAGAG